MAYLSGMDVEPDVLTNCNRTKCPRYESNGLVPNLFFSVILLLNCLRSGCSTQWLSFSVFLLRFLSLRCGRWPTRSQSSLSWKIHGTISPTVPFTGAHSTKRSIRFTTNTQHLLVWRQSTHLRLRLWSLGLGLLVARFCGVPWRETCIFSQCIAGLCCVCFRPSIRTAATSSLGVFTISFRSGLVLITMTCTTRNSSVTTPAASGGGTMFLTLNTPPMPSSDGGRGSPQRRRSDGNASLGWLKKKGLDWFTIAGQPEFCNVQLSSFRDSLIILLLLLIFFYDLSVSRC